MKIINHAYLDDIVSILHHHWYSNSTAKQTEQQIQDLIRKWKHKGKGVSPKGQYLKNNTMMQLSLPECMVKNHQNCNKRVAMKKASASDSTLKWMVNINKCNRYNEETISTNLLITAPKSWTQIATKLKTIPKMYSQKFWT